MYLGNRHHRSRLDPEKIRLPLIALIDVVFFLLLYFVSATSLAADERELGTTLATQGGAALMLQPQIINVDWSGSAATYRVGSRSFSDRVSLTDLLKTLPREAGLVVKAAPEAPVEITAGAVQAGRDAGFGNISFALATPAIEKPPVQTSPPVQP